MNRVLLILFLGLLFINFASAQSYGIPGSLGDLFSSIPSSTIVLGVIWIASFALIYFSMFKMFKGDIAVSATVAFAVSVFITWGANKNLDMENLFSGIGISPEFLTNILPLLLIGIVIFLFIALKTRAFLVMGGILSIISFTDLIVEKTILLVVGLILLGVGIGFEVKNRNKKEESPKKK